MTASFSSAGNTDLPLARFPLARTAEAYRAGESGTIGEILVDVST